MNLKLLLLVVALAVVCLAHKSRKKISSREVQRLSVRVSQRKCPARLVNKLQSQIEELQKATQSSKKSSKKHRSSKKISRHVQSALNILRRCHALIAKNMLTTPVVKLTTAKIVVRTTITPPKSTKAPEKSAKPSTAAANTTTTAQKPTTTASVTTKAARQKPTTASIVTTTAAIKPTTTFTAQKPTAAQKSTTTAPKITTATQKPFTTAAAHKPTTAAAPKPTTAAAQKPTTTAPVTTTASGQKSTAPKITTAAQNATTTAAPFRPTTEAPTSTKAIPKTATAAPETTTTAAKSIFKSLCAKEEMVEASISLIKWEMFTNTLSQGLPCFPDNSFCKADVEICIGYRAVRGTCDLVEFRSEIISNGRGIAFKDKIPSWTPVFPDLENPIHINFNRTRGINMLISLSNYDENPVAFTIDAFDYDLPEVPIIYNKKQMVTLEGTRSADTTKLDLGITYGCKASPIKSSTKP